MIYDVAVIGGGPAGASAALFVARAGKKALLVDADEGMTRRAKIHNHLGALALTGPELVELGHRQAIEAGAALVKATVSALVPVVGGFELRIEGGEFTARQVILATGASADLAERCGVATRAATQPRIKTVVVVDAAGRTDVPGIWAAGTIADVSVHTIVTAGDGARVAINLLSALEGTRWVDHDVLTV